MSKIKKILSMMIITTLAIASVGCQSRSEEVDTKAEVQEENRIIALSVSLVDILGELGVDMVGVPTS